MTVYFARRQGFPRSQRARSAKPGGLMVVQADSRYSTQIALAAGYAVTPYHVHVPTFGDWGFAVARRGDSSPRPTMPPNAPPLRFLNQSVLNAATVFPDDVRPRTLDPSTLEHPRVVEDMRHGYN